MYLSNYSATTLHLILMWSPLHVTSSEIRRHWVSVCAQGHGSDFWFAEGSFRSCDSKFMNMHSDKQVAWPGSVWELTDSNLSSHESGEWKKWRSLWEFHSWFFIGSCAVSWLVLKLWIKRADPSNLNKSESYRRVTSVTGVTWGGLWKGNIFFQKIIGH